MTAQDAPGTIILSREDESYPLRKRSAPEGFYEGQEGGKAMLDGDDYPDYEGAILEEQENDEPYGDI